MNQYSQPIMLIPLFQLVRRAQPSATTNDLKTHEYKWVVANTTFSYTYYHGDWVKINVPKGFITDFASVPRFAQSIISVAGLHLNAAIIHDWLYSGAHGIEYMTFELANEIFLDAMKASQVPIIRRTIMYNAVKWFGRSYYKSEPRDIEDVIFSL